VKTRRFERASKRQFWQFPLNQKVTFSATLAGETATPKLLSISLQYYLYMQLTDKKKAAQEN